jgi:protein gp37
MAGASSIEWTQATWNPVTGCDKVSQGCKHCYADRMARRLKLMGNLRYADGFAVRLHQDLVDAPLVWRRPRRIFVNSMSDLFHQAVPLDFIRRLFATMAEANWHTFQILTKRADRLADLAGDLEWPGNVWMGVSVECQDVAWRIDRLRHVPAHIRFLSCEPLLGPLDLDLDGIHWVIVGGESGPGARPMDLDWARGIRSQCWAAGVPFFLKQLGGKINKRGHDQARLDGELLHELPRVGAGVLASGS